MGVKSTVNITRREAEERIQAFLAEASNEAIASVLVVLADDASSVGECFENYTIVAED